MLRSVSTPELNSVSNLQCIFIPLPLLGSFQKKAIDLVVTEEEVKLDAHIPFSEFARRLTKALSNHEIPVGLTTSAVINIFNQDPHNKYYQGLYALEVLVSKEDLIEMQNGCALLKKNAHIAPQYMTNIYQLQSHQVKHPEKLLLAKNNAASTLANNLVLYDSASALQRLEQFIHDAKFWRAYTLVFDFPDVIEDLQKFLKNSDSKFSLAHLQEWVTHYDMGKYLHEQNSFDKAAVFFKSKVLTELNLLTKAFFLTIRNAESIYNIVDWIDSHYQLPAVEVQNRKKNGV